MTFSADGVTKRGGNDDSPSEELNLFVLVFPVCLSGYPPAATTVTVPVIQGWYRQ